MQLLAGAAKGIPRAGNVRYRTSCERAWETRHVRRDAEWHPKRATSRATDTVNIAFGTGTFIGCYMRSPGRNIFQACQTESPGFIPLRSGEYGARSLLRRLVTHITRHRLSLGGIRRAGTEVPWEWHIRGWSRRAVHGLLHKHRFRYRDVDVNGTSRNIHMHGSVRSHGSWTERPVALARVTVRTIKVTRFLRLTEHEWRLAAAVYYNLWRVLVSKLSIRARFVQPVYSHL